MKYFRMQNVKFEHDIINVPANSHQEAIAFAKSVLPDSDWQVVRELTPDEIKQLPIDLNN